MKRLDCQTLYTGGAHAGFTGTFTVLELIRIGVCDFEFRYHAKC
jgi:hypothetical protein